ncbi:serine/threonine protein phosphatase 2A 55 kDa regulatory subunit B beta isoform-like [Durio zibethinus]|uniref:Serine/threonine protein phosphatase 2A 55 kDa regulatory subunit B beta isoform-like n=1 Tax=Durio zibethinus TaxID=66656 RepID=A0A6P5ZP31_DURZI|nr:serine/threonine protein phosphatase 2A 55 kDa regulatory subunit B beta isoform-like [Durio zibethinus]XP_022754653.1 serine/threonine protein phosphatase 2A 55 kDa regulatory subunit B beta isoform-like [Durio zibethinus]
MDYPINWHPEFHYKTEFQSPEPESLTISKAWKLRRKLTKLGGASQLMVLCFFCLQMTKQSSSGSDGETFISADDPQINLWNLEISHQSFNIVDVKPANMEDLTGENPFVNGNCGSLWNFHLFLSSVAYGLILV